MLDLLMDEGIRLVLEVMDQTEGFFRRVWRMVEMVGGFTKALSPLIMIVVLAGFLQGGVWILEGFSSPLVVSFTAACGLAAVFGTISAVRR